ncbi:MAG: iron-containing redox enzyme family protein, partial [Candidatus Aenigmarchaeota archaeon]|nr:iron-containing redox enzyme family protein [Candidatus Aenigmarchaeota archaeon]
MPAWKLARPIAEFLSIEHWGSELEGAHNKYFIELANSLGISLEELESHRTLPETTMFAKTRTELCRKGPFAKTVGALGFANEYANSLIFPKYLTGVKAISERGGIVIPTDYFDAHIRDEGEDYRKF